MAFCKSKENYTKSISFNVFERFAAAFLAISAPFRRHARRPRSGALLPIDDAGGINVPRSSGVRLAHPRPPRSAHLADSFISTNFRLTHYLGVCNAGFFLTAESPPLAAGVAAAHSACCSGVATLTPNRAS